MVKKNILKTVKEKEKVAYKGASIRLSAGFSAESLQAGESGMTYSKHEAKLPAKDTSSGKVILQI